MSEEATEQGVSETEKQPNARDVTMDQIAEQLRAQRGPAIEPDDEPEEEIEIEAELDGDDDVEVELDVEKIKLKVDGEEIEVEKDKVLEAGIRTYQKESTADKRLQEATELLKQVQSSKEENNEIIEEDDIDYSVQDVLDMQAYGDTEGAAQALEALIDRRSQATVDVDQIREDVKKEIEKSFLEREFKSAVDRFQREYSDIYEDQRLMAVVAAEEQRLREAGDERPYWEVYDEIGKSVREWRGSTSGELETKKQKKKSIDNVTGGNAPSNKSQTYRPKSQEEIIEEMRAGRSAN